jgi:hypothetical protein
VRTARIEGGGDICLGRPRNTEGCRADDDDAAAADDDDMNVCQLYK